MKVRKKHYPGVSRVGEISDPVKSTSQYISE